MSAFDKVLLGVLITGYLLGPVVVTFYAIWADKRDAIRSSDSGGQSDG